MAILVERRTRVLRALSFAVGLSTSADYAPSVGDGQGSAISIESNPHTVGCSFYFTIPTTVPANDGEEGER
jgi:hypothetical protein